MYHNLTEFKFKKQIKKKLSSKAKQNRQLSKWPAGKEIREKTKMETHN